jgi:hypothetical protein
VGQIVLSFLIEHIHLISVKFSNPFTVQNGDGRLFGESGFTHSDLLRGHNQYVGRSLKVNGSFCRDTYTPMFIHRRGNELHFGLQKIVMEKLINSNGFNKFINFSVLNLSNVWGFYTFPPAVYLINNKK